MRKCLPLQQGIIYGPIHSKRLGRSLGINLLPTDKKVCTFDCLYCHYGRTDIKTKSFDERLLPSVREVSDAVEKVLAADKEFDYITYSGNGEPMLHPRFTEISEAVHQLRNNYRPELPIALLTNSTFLDDSEKVEALRWIDKPMFKFDAADQRSFTVINRPIPGIEVEKIIRNLIERDKKLIQTVFMAGIVENYRGEPFDHWLKAISAIEPEEVQIYSTDRPVEDERIEAVTSEDLKHLAREIFKKTGLRTEAYY